MPKPPSALFASGGGLHHLLSSPTVSSPPSSTTSRRRRGEISSLQFRLVHSSSNRPNRADDLSWPSSRSATSIPTPYEIFKLHPSAPYSKRRFYELVKLYHPDSSGHSFASSSSTRRPNSSIDPSSLPASLRIYRYRLIIQAHTILSDPARRSAYDRYGAGWDGMPDIEGIRRENSERGWRSYAEQADSPANCATWEDWEGWHEWRRQKEHSEYREPQNWFYKQRPVYASNGGFVVLIVFFTIAGAAHELSRAGRLSQTFKQQLEQVHVETLQGLKKTRNESRELEDNDRRVQRFLKDRKADPLLAAAIEEKEGMKSSPEPEVCGSGKVQGDGLQSP